MSALRFYLAGILALALFVPPVNSATHRFEFADGKPAAGAKVKLFVREEGKPHLEMDWVTNGDGEVEIKFRKRNTYHASVRIVEAEGAATGIWRNFSGGGEGGKPLVLAPAFAVDGIVVTEEGKPVAGAKVRVGYFGGGRTYVPVYGEDLKRVPGFETMTDKGGRFVLKGATLNGYRWGPGAEILVEAELGGRLHTGLQGRRFAGDSDFFDKPPEGVKWEESEEITVFVTESLRGKVTDRLTGEPVAGVKISVWNDRFPDTATTTDAGGRFEIERTYRHGGRSIEFTHPDFVEARFRETKPRAAGEGEVELDVELRPLVETRGKVLEAATGKPFPTPISVSFESYEPGVRGGWKEWWGRCHHRAEIGEDGSFVFPLPVGKCRMSVGFTVSKGSAFPFDREFSMEVKPGGEPVEFRLVRKERD